MPAAPNLLRKAFLSAPSPLQKAILPAPRAAPRLIHPVPPLPLNAIACFFMSSTFLRLWWCCLEEVENTRKEGKGAPGSIDVRTALKVGARWVVSDALPKWLLKPCTTKPTVHALSPPTPGLATRC